MHKLSFENYEIKKSAKKVDYEFQALGMEMESLFKTKQVWSLFHKADYNVRMIDEAYRICKKSGKPYFPYLMGVLKKLNK